MKRQNIYVLSLSFGLGPAHHCPNHTKAAADLFCIVNRTDVSIGQIADPISLLRNSVSHAKI